VCLDCVFSFIHDIEPLLKSIFMYLKYKNIKVYLIYTDIITSSVWHDICLGHIEFNFALEICRLTKRDTDLEKAFQYAWKQLCNFWDQGHSWEMTLKVIPINKIKSFHISIILYFICMFQTKRHHIQFTFHNNYYKILNDHFKVLL
jgi:hypothetical protein